ncbi:hypothetical protein DLJ53_31345 [Acuticoccus sediminis]|uniref:Tripartite tricarboxylate transporter TctB family protein n=1 Tax=Acuticoccus sediminis TaxID=2184697 RepID=A0A8B2NPP1_9HYPH|nr:hypothetical protein [Acuticoccus sediminis]RAH96760.1 hypothetical protein DLJ53_31345 [Acuticoccus sediminis]
MRAAPVIEFAIVGGLCAVAYFVLIPAQISAQGAVGLRADVVPRVAVVAIALFALLHMVARLTVAAPPSTAPDPGGNAGEAAPPLRYVALLLTAIAAGYAGIIWLGLVAGGAVTVLLITLALGERRPLRLALHALGGAAVAGLIPLLGL